MRVEHQIAIDTPRPFKLLHQTLCLNNIDFETERIFGYTELIVIPLIANLRSMRLNCSKQCHIDSVIVQDGIDAAFTHDDVFALFRHTTTKLIDAQDVNSFDQVKNCLLSCASNADSDKNGGQLLIRFPAEIFGSLDQRKAIRIRLNFRVDGPMGGLKFVVDRRLDGGTWRERASHMFTWRQCVGGAEAWFPCVDSASELSMWKIEISCDTALTAVCSGELQEVSYTSDLRRKNYSYVLTTPSPARNIGICVGVFDIFVHPDMTELSAFCPPQLTPMLKYTCRNLHKVFEFFEELMSSRYPYGSMKICFVDQLPLFDLNQALAYSSLLILNVKCLYQKRIIDQAPITRRAIASGLASQFFGYYLVPGKSSDSWVCLGLARYLAALYCQKTFGNNEYLYGVYEDLNEVIDYERKWGGIILHATGECVNDSEPDPLITNSILRCPIYQEMYAKKSLLVLRVLEKKLGKELVLQVINKLLSVCAHAAQQRVQPACWNNGILLTTQSFLKCVSSVTGHDLQSFAEQFVHKAGHPEFVLNYAFNRKRNTIELEVKQDLSINGSVRFIGSVTVVVQELDGSFSHTVQIDDLTTRHDIQCHSKARRQRKRKIPLWTGEEVDVDLACLDPDSPLLWIRFDPELLTIGRCIVNQPDYQWLFQLKHEKDVVAQMAALSVLPRFPTSSTRLALIDVIKCEQCFYRIRCRACFALSDVSNKLLNLWSGPPIQISIFNSIYGSKSTSNVPRLNNFSNFQHYFLAKSLIASLALSKSGGSPNLAPMNEPVKSGDVHKFFVNLCKFNNNSQNKFGDDFYRAEYLESFGNVVTKNLKTASASPAVELSDDQLRQISEIVRELTHALNNEKIKPSYNKIVSVACLRGLARVREAGRLSDRSSDQTDPAGSSAGDLLTLWWSFFRQESYLPLKRASLECVIDFLLSRRPIDFYDSSRTTSAKFDSSCYDKFIDFLNDDDAVYPKSYALHYLTRKLTFSAKNRRNYLGSIFKRKACFQSLLKLMCKDHFGDPMTLNLTISLILILFGSDSVGFTSEGFLIETTNDDVKAEMDYDLLSDDVTII